MFSRFAKMVEPWTGVKNAFFNHSVQKGVFAIDSSAYRSYTRHTI